MDHPLLLPGSRLVIGHRGNAMFAPENTIPSIAQALERGADAVEIDVHLSADGEVMVIHDPTVDRTTSGRGAVATLTAEELRRFDAGARFTADGGNTFPWRGQGIHIPTLAEVLRQFPGTPLVIELKTARAQQRVLDVIRAANAEARTVLASFDLEAVTTLRAEGLKTGASRPELFSMFIRSSLHMSPRTFGFDAVFLPRRYHGVAIPCVPFLRAAAPSGIAVHTWVENDPAVATRLWQAGVNGIVTDDPGTLVRARPQGR